MAFQARFVQNGNSLDYTPTADVAAGAVVVRNSLIGVTPRFLPANQPGSIVVAGVFDVVKDGLQINDGAAVFWDKVAGYATTVSEANDFMGFSLGVALAGDPTVRVLLAPVTGVANTIHNAMTNVIADPGVGGAIPVADTGSCALATVAPEARTLAVPTYVGQMLALTLKTDGGDCTVTVAEAVNQAGNNVLTFNDAGDTIVLIGADVGGNRRWRVMSNDGVVLSTS